MVNLGIISAHIPFESSWDIQVELKGWSKECVIVLVLVLGGVLISAGVCLGGSSVLSGLTASRNLLQSLAMVAGIFHKLLPEESVKEVGGHIQDCWSCGMS